MTSLPRVVIAAPGSGHGKTMMATGLMGALRARGLEVSPHKVGPDYIDPGYHALAAGRPGRNLDPHLQGEGLVEPLLLHGAHTPVPADVAVIEGVMGLFDGALGSGGFASTAHVATLTRSPVVLVVDCAASSRSVGAVVQGFATFDPQVRVTGVILNNVASPRHEAEARNGVAATGVPVVGVVPRLPDLVVPSRHLGLVPAAERAPEAVDAVAGLGRLVAEYVDLDAILDIARAAPDLESEPWTSTKALAGAAVALPAGRPRIAVAAGVAFTFGYAETAELLEAAGAEVVPFDPLADPLLPAGIGGLLLGGGFPEVHVEALGRNESLLDDVRAFMERGGVVAAECAGLLYLGQALEDVPMVGALPFTAEMHGRLTLGYRSAVALHDNLLCRAGERVTGHEFHRTRTLVDDGSDEDAWGWTAGETRRMEGFATASVHASYLHVHWAGHPHLAARFVSAAARADRGVVLGVGGRPGAPVGELIDLARGVLASTGRALEDVSTIATVRVRSREPALVELARRTGARLTAYEPSVLAVQPVNHGSERVRRHVGTPSVAEAAVLASRATLTVHRHQSDHWVVAAGEPVDAHSAGKDTA